jgi:hypothetical protein
MVPFQRKPALYMLASLSFTLLSYGATILALRNDQLFVSLLLLGYLNLFISSFLADFLQSLSKFFRVLLLLGILVLVMIEGTFVTSFGFTTSVSGNASFVENDNIGIYGGLQNNVSVIDWGLIYPGSSKDVAILVSNEGNTNLVLRLSTRDWVPEPANNYITLSWDYDGQVIRPQQAVRVVLTLYVSEYTTRISDFTFTIVIIGEQVS